MPILAALLAAAQPAAPPASAVPVNPEAVVTAAPASAWRDIAPENLLLMDTAAGRMLIELAPDFAPAHVAAVRALVRAGRFDGGAIVRVQDNYVVQWMARPDPAWKPAPLPAEYDRPLAGLRFTPLGFADAYADAGFVNGWPVGRKGGRVWPAHCYATVGVGRENPPDTGDGAELYAVIGHAPRHLDRNLAIVGRVIAGIEPHAALPRGSEALGFYRTPAERTAIRQVRLASDVYGAPRWQVMDTTSPAFAELIRVRANRTGFLVQPAGAIELCNMRVPVRQRP